MRDIEAIGKDRRNQAQGFNFRGIDDVYNELHQTMAKHGLFTVPRVVAERCEDRQTKSGGNAIYRVLSIEFDFIDETGDKITVGPMIGEGMDSGDKASNKAHSIAHKYALLQVFMIPTVEKKDPDEESYATASATAQTPALAPAGQSRFDGIRIQQVDRMPASKPGGKEYWKITTATGSVCSTFSDTLADVAKNAAEIGSAVTITVEKNGNFWNLKGIA
jgi:hypothetical protein